MALQARTKPSMHLTLVQDWFPIMIGAMVGAGTGMAAVGFNETLLLVERWSHQLHLGRVAGPGLAWVVITPVVGMFLTGLLVHLIASDAKGHGVPQVMESLIKAGGVMKLRTGIVKALASILTVGSGGSGGTEGPIVQIGAVAGSFVGQKMRVDRQLLMTLVGCGSAAGISSIFNAPIAGVFFVLEILLRDFSIRTFAPIVVSSVFSAVTTQALLGKNLAIFTVDASLHDAQFTLIELPSFLLLGAVSGLVAVGFNKFLHFMEDAFDRVRVRAIYKPVIGAVVLGGLGVATVYLARAGGAQGDAAHVPAVYGNGYSVIRTLLEPSTYAGLTKGSLPIVTLFLLALLVLKVVATSFTLASGGSGGVFAPSLMLGAVGGAIFGHVLELLHLTPGGSTPATYALVGMAAVLAGSMHAPLTAMLLLFELTRNFYVILPIMLAAILATAVSQLLDRDSIYTAKLRRAGVLLGGSRDLTLLRKIAVSSVVRTPLPPEPIYASDPLSKLITLHANYNVPDFPVVDQGGQYMGMVTGADMRTALIDREAVPLLLVAELLRPELPTIAVDESLDSVMEKFALHEVASLCLIDPASPGRPLALISRTKVMKRYREALEQD
ncbi:MAG: chloride channel protein [Phycisphaerales bacterium]|nr:chloride channel protein [Phycisphaerales bacterium]